MRDPEHSDGAPTIEGTGIRVEDVAIAYEHSGHEPDEIIQLYPDLSLGDVHRVLVYYYDNIDDFRSGTSRFQNGRTLEPPVSGSRMPKGS